MSWRQAAVAMAAIAMSTTVPMGSAFAADAKLSLSGEVEYDDNVFRTRKNEENDVIFRITPRTKIYEDEGKFNWSVEYWMPFEQAVDNSDIEDLNHFVTAISEYQVSRTTSLTFSDRFRYSDAAGRSQNLEGDNSFSLGSFRDPVIRNHVKLGIEHQFTRRTSGFAQFGHKLFDTDLPRRANSQTYLLNTRVMHQYRPQHRLGGGLAVTYQVFEKSNNDVRPKSQNLFVNMFGAWTWFIDEKTTFEITGGPTFIDTNQDDPEASFSDENVISSRGNLDDAAANGIRVSVFDTDLDSTVTGCARNTNLNVNFVVLGSLCTESHFLDPATDGTAIGLVEAEGTTTYAFDGPILGATPEDQSDTQWTFFGQVSLTRRWTPHLTSTLSYTRQQSTASGVAGSAILDVASLINRLQLSERWWLDFRGDFTLRQSTSKSTQTLLVVARGIEITKADAPSLPIGPGESVFLAQTTGATGELFSRSVNQLLDTRRWGTTVRLRYRVNKNLWLSLRHVYTQQDSKGDSIGNSSDYTNQLFTFGVQYDFDRIHLW